MSEPPLPSARRQLLFDKYRPFLTTPFFFGFSAHVLTPKIFPRLLGSQVELPLTNALWCGSHVGITIYLYTSKHLRSIHTFERLLYSIYGSAMFNFGTVLIMTIVRSIFPDKEVLRLGLGLSLSGIILLVGQKYIHYIDEVFDAVRFRSVK
ncbi:unnamed protein product [Rotaria magnacalcarata]|uniref:Uncharacterized protein n=1 Tax=Rotaria magnacalcarata TaxID=392030 RepID=A0A818W9L5_9BILA|nr:unnamed protein product [Rotaria magnacalcarata]CAF2137438.1 unnamed protein product [Rotaria magnacalcarata]CAF2150093.1 unnamed protein product [Rotaria magnacalcarata]CAF3722293.1 unnamed protein product [Rotaria magnacalcarata]CAF4208991.1 unnamed protein product [Rotaria magnacalcarata]